jgi:hypothetical protein
VNRILRIDTGRWVTGRAIRWAAEDAKRSVTVFGAAHPPERHYYTCAGTTWRGPEDPSIVVTTEFDSSK